MPLPNPLSLSAAAVSTIAEAPERVRDLLGGAERLLTDVNALLARIEQTRQRADEVVADVAVTQRNAQALLEQLEQPQQRLVALLDRLEPPLTALQPTLDKLAQTTSPREVDALVALIDHLPRLVGTFEKDLVPILDSLSTVAPDLHDLLDVSRELNELIGKVPGLGRIKRKVEEEQEEMQQAQQREPS